MWLFYRFFHLLRGGWVGVVGEAFGGRVLFEFLKGRYWMLIVLFEEGLLLEGLALLLVGVERVRLLGLGLV
jgi:hypothetical protein